MIVTCKKPCGVAGRLPKWPRILVALGFFALGCTSIPSGTGTTGNGDGGAADDNLADSVGSIDNVGSTVTLSGSREFNVIYSIPAGVSLVEAVYVQVADAIPGSAEVGERVVFGQALAGGDSQAVLFDTTLLDPGLYRVGISYVDAFGVPVIFFSDGVVDVQGQPDPVFFEPTTSITGEPGIALLVSFDARDPEDLNVRWRLFYADKTDIDVWAANPASISNPSELGTQLATGSTNVGSYTWNTAGLQPGEYGLGVSATDSGSSIDNTDDNLIITGFMTEDGQLVSVTLVEPEPDPLPPTLTVTAPSTDISVFPGTNVTISWDADFFEGPVALVDVFYDQDGDADTEEDNIFLIINGDSSVISTTLATGALLDGEYHVGVIADDGLNERVTRFASGTVTVDGEVIFTVDSPSNDRTVPPGTLVDVSWSSNVPSTLATYDVIVQTDPIGDGDPDDYGDPVDLAIDTTSTSVSFDTTGLTGLFVFTVTMTVSSLDNAEFEASVLPGTVRVSTAPPIIWLGALTATQGAIFQGVNFEDNAGSAFTALDDMDGDGVDDFIIVARYGKPFFQNSSGGIGNGEAYLIYGSNERLTGILDLNSVGQESLRGLTFTGIRTPQDSDETDGLADVLQIPDVDSDGRPEIVFGFPNVNSQGHNLDIAQNGAEDLEDQRSTLEKHDQFLRGGIVILSSKTEALQNPDGSASVINLDLVGQDFDRTCVLPEPGVDEGDFFLDIYNEADGCSGSCASPSSDDQPDANSLITYGFHVALADNYHTAMVVPKDSCIGGYLNDDCGDPESPLFIPTYDARWDFFCAFGFHQNCAPATPGLHWFPENGIPNTEPFNDDFSRNQNFVIQQSGFYPYEYDPTPDDDDEDNFLNTPLDPIGARIIGVGLGDGFGASISLSNATGSGTGDLLVSSPNRKAVGFLFQTENSSVQGPEDGVGYIQGGEINGLDGPEHVDSGVAYLFELRNLWEGDSFGRIPPKPHQYIVGEQSHSCFGPAGTPSLIPNIEATRIAGNTGQKISRMVGISDFNGDGLNDIAVGSPGPESGGGVLHIVYRRQEGLEGDFVLAELELDPSDPERLQGSFITGNRGDVNGEGFGASMVTGFDFDGDGLEDLVVSTPNDSLGTGAVDIIFNSPDLITPQGGTSIEDLRNDRRSVRITGLEGGDLFGFNLANAGDVDGDGLDDLLIAAPGASPKHDPNPNDSMDELSAPGLDVDGDGEADFTLDNAGLVYLILGSNVLGDDSFYDQERFPDGVINISALGTSDLRGAIIVGKADGDRLGGGDAGSLVEGGITDKAGRGRSFGLKAAGDVDGDGKADILIGSVLADFVDPLTGAEKKNSGEAYLLYGFEP